MCDDISSTNSTFLTKGSVILVEVKHFLPVSACACGTFWLMRLTHGEVQLLKSGPWGSQYPSGPTHMYEAMPGEGTKTTAC